MYCFYYLSTRIFVQHSVYKWLWNITTHQHNYVSSNYVVILLILLWIFMTTNKYNIYHGCTLKNLNSNNMENGVSYVLCFINQSYPTLVLWIMKGYGNPIDSYLLPYVSASVSVTFVFFLLFIHKYIFSTTFVNKWLRDITSVNR